MAHNASIYVITRYPSFPDSVENQYTSIIHFVLFIAPIRFNKNCNIEQMALQFVWLRLPQSQGERLYRLVSKLVIYLMQIVK